MLKYFVEIDSTESTSSTASWFHLYPIIVQLLDLHHLSYHYYSVLLTGLAGLSLHHLYPPKSKAG